MKKNEVKKVKPEKLKHYKPCPKHGKDYLVQEGVAVFCYAETPGDIIPHCFYHVFKTGRQK